MAQEKIDLQKELQKELKLMKETQSGFNSYISLSVIQPRQLIGKNLLFAQLRALVTKPI